MSKFYIGIDPGSEPAVTSMLSPTKFKTKKFKKVKGKFDSVGMYEFLLGELLDLHPEGRGIDVYDVDIFLEDVHSVFNSSAKSNFQFGIGVGECRAAAKIAIHSGDFPATLELVQPKTWQKLVREPEDKVIKDNKATALNSVKRILGDNFNEEDFFPTKRSYTVNHDMIDSYLLAYYGYLKNNQ